MPLHWTLNKQNVRCIISYTHSFIRDEENIVEIASKQTGKLRRFSSLGYGNWNSEFLGFKFIVLSYEGFRGHK